jgi:ABC-type transport system substrate-binding protein
MRIRDHQLDPAQATPGERAQKVRPERLGLRGADRHAQQYNASSVPVLQLSLSSDTLNEQLVESPVFDPAGQSAVPALHTPTSRPLARSPREGCSNPADRGRRVDRARNYAARLAGRDYDDPAEIELYDRMLRETDFARQRHLMRQFEKLVLDTEAHEIFLLWRYRIVPYRSYVKGWKVSPSHYVNQDLATIWLDK